MANIRGDREDLKTNPLTFEAEATKGEDATKVGAGAVGGAILGGILGGQEGRGEGRRRWWRGRHRRRARDERARNVSVNEGTDVTATLAQPLTLRMRVALISETFAATGWRTQGLHPVFLYSDRGLVLRVGPPRPLRGLKSNLRMRPVAERLLRRPTAPT
jgi:hypothetical protein